MTTESPDVETLLGADPSGGRVALAARVALAHADPPLECPMYCAALDRALAEEPPPFDSSAYADIYRGASEDVRWMAVSLITNAEREGDGATRLWSLAACSADEDERQLLKQHAIDESTHALYYLSILDLAFPGMADPAFRRELNSLSPGFSRSQPLAPVPGSPYAKQVVIDDFLQMNIAEIRTTIHHIMQRTAIAQHCSDASLRPIAAIQRALLRDELRHVAYTAQLIERRAREGRADAVAALFVRRFRDFNRITTNELGTTVFDCSVACCERHPGCRSKATAEAPLRASLS
jgi:hypothetical protein